MIKWEVLKFSLIERGATMKKITIFIGLLMATTLYADTNLSEEKEVLNSLEKYFNARNKQDYRTVISLESRTGIYNTNSDGSFHKTKQITSVESWKRSNQGGVINVFYPQAIQLSEDVVFVRFYFEGVAEAGGQTSDYRTRVTMNWTKEDGKWVVKSQHYSPANYGGVHQTQMGDFEEE